MRTFLHIRNGCFYFVAVTVLVLNVSCKSTQKSQNSAPAPIVVQPPAPLADPVPTIKEVSKDVVKQLKVALIMPFELNVNFGEVTDEILEPQISP
ncbi:MAG: hypothetical protein IPP71_12795 [Bacteroidetes bacterium]|nr:hypothetical protein [Bacteroidota bacterium]